MKSFTEREIMALSILQGELESAESELEAKIAEEEDDDYSDAMVSMERAKLEGIVETLERALAIMRGAL
jgi:hypothetical protein